MKKFAILRIEKLSSYSAISASGQHAFRERDTPNADPDLLHLNQVVGAKSSEGIIAAVRSRIEELDEAQPQGVKCVEYLITASPEAFSLIDDAAYFSDSLEWIKRKHGSENVVCSVIHRDETTPHMSVFVVPVVQRDATTRKRSVSVKGGGRELREYPVPARSELSCKHYFGNREKLSRVQTDFADQVGKRHGLERGVHRAIGGERVTHIELKSWYATMAQQKQDIEAKKTCIDLSLTQLEADRKQFASDRIKLTQSSVQLEEAKRALAGQTTELSAREKALHANHAKLDSERLNLREYSQSLADKQIVLENRERGVLGRESKINEHIKAVEFLQERLILERQTFETQKSEHEKEVVRMKQLFQEERRKILANDQLKLASDKAELIQNQQKLSAFWSELKLAKENLMTASAEFNEKTKGFTGAQIQAAIKHLVKERSKVGMSI